MFNFMVLVYKEDSLDICREFESYREAKKFARGYERYAIFKLVEKVDKGALNDGVC